jgi:hypothetical protein
MYPSNTFLLLQELIREGQIKRRQNQIRTRPIDQGGKRVEARLALGCCAEPKGFLADPPLRHDRRLQKTPR